MRGHQSGAARPE